MSERMWDPIDADGRLTGEGPMTDADVLAEMGGQRVGVVRRYADGFGWGWFVPDNDPNPEGLRKRVWIVKEAGDE